MPSFLEHYTGPGRIETYTVIYGRNGYPAFGSIIGRTPENARFVARIPAEDAAGIALLTAGEIEPVGRAGQAVEGTDGRVFCACRRIAVAQEAELIIRGGTVADGLGGEPYAADVAVGGGRILAVGKVHPQRVAPEEIDARGMLVTPGFVDMHTHYDAQATWSSRLDSSSWNGVTTALIGNCGVGFAPCLPERRDMLVTLMEGVEDLPEVVLTEGLPWNWESFPDFLEVLAHRPYDMDIATQVPHAALRIHVMGQRAADHEQATPADRKAMAQLAAEGIQAGALGFSTSRAIAHKTLDGRHTPTLARRRRRSWWRSVVPSARSARAGSK